MGRRNGGGRERGERERMGRREKENGEADKKIKRRWCKYEDE